MADLIREAPLGQFLRLISGNRLFKYPEEETGYELPQQYRIMLEGHRHDTTSEKPKGGIEAETPSPAEHANRTLSDSADSGNDNAEDGSAEDERDIEAALGRTYTRRSSINAPRYSTERQREERELGLQKSRSVPIVPQKTADGAILVDWYDTDDPANPQNWSRAKKALVIFVLCTYTFTVYCTGPVYAAAEGGIVDDFGVSAVAATLGLSLYVLAYGIGDLLFSPLTEIPVIGRNPVYYLTFIVFWVLAFSPPVVKNFGGLLTLRFLLGFFGSPALANGGATVGDMFELIYIPFGLLWWVFSAWFGPALGPLIGGFATQAETWRWAMWEVVWMASPCLVLLLVVMPETSAANILLRKARRLRKLTGDARLQSQSEIDQRNLKASEIAYDALIKPMEIMIKDPSILFVNVYTGYFYGVFYTFFEVFPLVFPVYYGMNLGQTGVTFLSCIIAIVLAIAAYSAYLFLYMIPDNLKNGFREQEHRLVPALIGSVFMPAGLFLFAWTANPHIHWAVPLVGVGIFVQGHFFVMQSLFVYLPFSYPQYAASLFAGNSLWRSALGCAAVIFARPLFLNLGVSKGVTLLGGLSVAGFIGCTMIYIFGKQLRARSKFAAK